MAYAEDQVASKRTWALAFVLVLHAVLGYAFVTGLAGKMVQLVVNDLEVVEVAEEPPKNEEPPPPPEKLQDVEVYVPPVDLPIQLPPPPKPPETIRATVTEMPPPAPQRVVPQPPAPVVAAAPVTTPAPAPIPRKSAQAKGRGNSISQDDYPTASLRAEEEGSVRVRYVVGVNGRAGNCQIIQSSGFPRLDERSCEVIMRRFRFTPASENGQPVEEPVTLNVTWRIDRR